MNIAKLLNSLFHKRFWNYVLVALAAFLIYAPTLKSGFVYFDDQALVIDRIHELKSPTAFSKAFTDDVFGGYFNTYYRPVFMLSWILDAWVGDTQAWVYHLTNIGLHMLCAMLVFALFMDFGYSKRLSTAIGLLFALHPVTTMAVAWIPGRNDPLLALFMLVATIELIHYFRKPGYDSFLFHALAYLVALFTKETALFLPLIWLFLWWKFSPRDKSKLISLASVWIGLILFWGLLRFINFDNPMHTDPLILVQSIFFSLGAGLQMFGKTLFPFGLTLLPVLESSTYLFGLSSLAIVLFCYLVIPKHRKKYLFLGLIWFAVTLIPNLMRPELSSTAYFLEHRIYLCLVGSLFIFSELLRNLYPYLKIQKGIVIALLVIFAALTLRYEPVFHNRIAFWEKAHQDSPTLALATRNLGAMYYLDKRLDESESLFQETLKLSPNEAMVYNNLGLIAMDKNNFFEAEELYVKAIELDPVYADAYFNLGLLYIKLNQWDKSEQLFLKTLEFSPGHSSAITNLALYYHFTKNKTFAKLYVIQMRDRNIPIHPILRAYLQ